jgi:thiamine pyrophosphokinase
MNKRMIVVTGGEKTRASYDKACHPADYIIGVDGGALWMMKQGLDIDFAIGDFDTIGQRGLTLLQEKGVTIRSFPPEKDMSDTALAISEAVSLGAKQITLFGGIGSRFDHSLANAQLLWFWLQRGIKITIIDSNHRIQLIQDVVHIDSSYPFISLIPYTMSVEGISLQGFRYPLKNATLQWGDSLGISNELKEKNGKITVKTGSLLVIQARED